MSRRLLMCGLVAAMLAVGQAAAADQGKGDPRLTVSPREADPARVTEITVTGTDYLVPPHAPDVDVFGGVYVLFGWVSDPSHFGPSVRNSTDNRGVFGETYLYPGNGGDAETRDDGSGAIRLVSFTAGGESGEATDFHMDDVGNWTTTLRVFGSTFTSTIPQTGETVTTDCTQVQCGVFTIGAHGKASATNELFAPVDFATPPTSTTAPTPTTVAPTTSVPLDRTDTTAAVDEAVTPPTEPPVPPTTSATTVSPAVAVEVTDGPPPPPEGSAIELAVVSTSSTGSFLPVLIAVAAVGAGAAALAWWRRRRRIPATST